MEKLSQVLERINRERVEYVLVGGLAAVVYGVTLVTRDVDVCLPFTEGNLRKLEKALAGLHPVHRQTPQQRPFSVAEDFPRGLKNMYLRTDLGILDCLGEIKGIGTYEQVYARSVVAELPIGLCRILDLAALIESKQALDRTQDKLAMIQLREIQKRGQRL